MPRFAADRVGSKAMHLAKLAGKLPDWVRLPASVALTFGSFEAALAAAGNEAVAARYEQLAARVNDQPVKTLEQLRQVIDELQPTPELKEKLFKAAHEVGLTLDENFPATFSAIRQVWASKWTDRAYWSRRRLGIDHASLRMAVLIQQVIDADYAFVLHTVNPMTGDRGEVFGEIVVGLGETLVGNYPGRPLSFVADKSKGGETAVVNFASKGTALRGGGVICRSDSNGEDLAGYAGAGLYESVLVQKAEVTAVDYTRDRLANDEAFRQSVLSSLGQLGCAVEAACGGPQDIEGVISDGRYHVVQTRPQVGLED